MKNVAAQVALQKVKKDKRGGAELGRGEPAVQKRRNQQQWQNQV